MRAVAIALTKSRDDGPMSRYRRPKCPGATVFFTVNLADRSSGVLVEQVDVLREAVRQTRAARPFVIDAWGARRLGNDPGDRFRYARAEPRMCCRITCIACGHCPKGMRITPSAWVPSKAGSRRWSVGRGSPRLYP
ncbi:hypothetical protein RCCS2_15359 [Roseobacter sp. CCS2]|nr:hypothetical protein RCCS2_15359 [Roseobacter sp. CCS2]